ncbi:UDP-N-acetylmuramoyl-L-alanyl-D-glutamate--2,6-diaminopimelate ligase [Kangiella sp. TOML190]|uniref:UDP-N-acetylmuramoyl-L-alanyl-D-glutamate--2, 6-diaminopimelate ligase n=1 Tax=Kangiella sp. TOML190 TaxID=2931351 RepID=UPI00204086B0|nr:UDP-N-acetylmuramoyl-L-alanyl-D-glutamate--2,6-diaminopimelate ligase [Kangiella sp. TOML190]
MTSKPKNSISLKKILKGSLKKEQLKALNLKQIKVTGISLDSRQVKAGDVFLAYPGVQTDGRQFIAAAIAKGAIAIVAEADNLETYINDLHDDNRQETEEHETSVTMVPVPNLANKVSRISGKFYGSPSKKMSLIGITGTNGKTSIAYLVAQALQILNKPTLLLSTLGNGDIQSLELSKNTTADPVTIQQLASEFLAKGYHHLAMEVSSHGLDQGRVNGLKFNLAVFTNLSHDHLEYHGDMETYFQAKRQLFLRKEVQYAVINADDSYGRRLLLDDQISAKKIAFSRQQQPQEPLADFDGDWVVSSNESFDLKGINADLTTPWGTGRLHSSLLGDFNLSNLLAVAAILGCLNGDLHKWIVALNGVKPVLGRMQQFAKADKATLVVDYAHTPDALEKALQTLRHHCQGNLWCVFGCGGDRDPSKRALMGSIAEQNANKVILTDDNPRTENAAAIVEMVRADMLDKTIPYVSPRKDAIELCYREAAATDMVLIAGKGHEDYQEIGHEKLPYSDLATVNQLLEASA